MNPDASFPILNDSSVIPEKFCFSAVDFSHDQCSALRQIGCTAIIAVDSPLGWTIRRRGDTERRHIDLFVLLTGTVVTIAPHRTWVAKARQALITPSWVAREIRVTEASYHLYIRFDVPEIFPGLNQIFLHDSLNSEAMDAIIRLLLLPQPLLLDEHAYRSHLLESLSILFRRELEQSMESVSPVLGTKLLQYLRTASGPQFAVAKVAQKFGMSLSAFRCFCLNNFGQSPSILINEIRMARARALLNYSDMPIPGIALHLGFADRFVFSKAFRRSNQVSPGEFRQNGAYGR